MCFFQSLTAAFNCYNLQYLLARILSLDNVGAFFFLNNDQKTHRPNSYQRVVLIPNRASQPLIGCVLISHTTRLALKSKDFYHRTFNRGSVRSVGKACDCRAGGRGFDSRGRTNTQGLKIS